MPISGSRFFVWLRPETESYRGYGERLAAQPDGKGAGEIGEELLRQVTNSGVFEWAARTVIAMTRLSAPQARGALRLMLKEAGLEPDSLTPLELKYVAESVAVKHLLRQGVANPDPVVSALNQCPLLRKP